MEITIRSSAAEEILNSMNSALELNIKMPADINAKTYAFTNNEVTGITSIYIDDRIVVGFIKVYAKLIKLIKSVTDTLQTDVTELINLIQE